MKRLLAASLACALKVCAGVLAHTNEDLDVPPSAIVGAAALLSGGVGAVVGLAVGATKTRTVYEAAGAQTRHK